MVNYSLFPALTRQSTESTEPRLTRRISTTLRRRFSTISRISFGASRIFNDEEFDLVHNYLAGSIDFPLPPLDLNPSNYICKAPTDASSSEAQSRQHAHLSHTSSMETVQTPTSTGHSSDPPTWSPATSRVSACSSPEQGKLSTSDSFWTAPQSRQSSSTQYPVTSHCHITSTLTNKSSNTFSTAKSSTRGSTKSSTSQDVLWPGWNKGIGGANRESIMRDSSVAGSIGKSLQSSGVAQSSGRSVNDAQSGDKQTIPQNRLSLPVCTSRSERMFVAKRVFGITVGAHPLIEASRENSYGEVTRLLNNKRTNIDITDKHGMTALHWTCRLGNTEACRTLLSRGAATNIRTKKCDYDALYMAVRHSKSAIVQLLAKHRASLDATCSMDGSTSLHAAALTGFMDGLEILLGAGAYVNALDSEGMTPLWWAGLSRQNDAAKLLIEHGANLETKIKLSIHVTETIAPMTVLWQALMVANYKLIRLLLTNGANANSPGSNGMCPLHWAAGKGDLLSVTLLLEHEADSEGKTDAGWTALHYAARNGHKRVCQLLVRCGANEKAKTNCGLTPAQVACKHGHGYGL